MMRRGDYDIKCPVCRKLAKFTYANSIGVKKNDYEYFSKSNIFNILEQGKWSSNRRAYYALHYPYLMPKLENIADLPEDYAPEKWGKRDFYGEDIKINFTGVVACSFCDTLQKHKIKWPEEAYFQIEYKGQTLWAYDRSTAIKLKNYISSDTRIKRHPASTDDYVFQDYFLRKVPENFQSSKARDDIIRKLDKLLS